MSIRFCPKLTELEGREVPAIFGNPWPSSNLTLSFAADGTKVDGVPSQLSTAFSGIPAASWQSEVLRAFQTWAAAANINIGVVADGGQDVGVTGPSQYDPRFGDIRIAAIPLDANAAALAMPYDVNAGTRSGDVWFNSALPFSLGNASDNNIYAVALHEAGHVFGLAGSNDPTSAMYDSAIPRTGLSASDVLAIQALYGIRRADSYDAKISNGTLTTASPIQVGSGPGSSATADVLADITTSSDADVYVFKSNNLQGLGLTVSVNVNGYSLLVPRVQVLKANGQVVADNAGTQPGASNVSMHINNLTPGATYYVRVTGARTDVFGIGGYRLVVRPDAASAQNNQPQLLNPDAGTNDTINNATQLGQQYLTGTGSRVVYTVAASLNTSTDVDFYRLKTPQTTNNIPVTMTVSVTTTLQTGTEPIVEVFNKNGQRVWNRVLVHEGGTFTTQIVGATPNEDYYVAVRHAHPGSTSVGGNYNLFVDFRQPTVELTQFASANLTASGPLMRGTFVAHQQQVLHLVFDASQNPASDVKAARLTVLDAANHVLGTRLIHAGEVTTFNLLLRPGTYRYIVGAGTTDGSVLGNFQYSLSGVTLSDPIGPRPINPNGPSGNPPAPATPGDGPIKVYPPGTIRLPPTPTSPPWWLAPPTDWTPTRLLSLVRPIKNLATPLTPRNIDVLAT
ncbi:MAG: matrixin family metalloprotease [Gemmataceae bacterium]